MTPPRFLPILALALTVASAATRAATADPPGAAVDAVVNVDVIPGDQKTGAALLTGFARRAARDPAVGSVRLIGLSAAPNHFILEEGFADRAAYQLFVAEPYVRAFRADLAPHLGSPWDERLGSAVAP